MNFNKSLIEFFPPKETEMTLEKIFDQLKMFYMKKWSDAHNETCHKCANQ